MSNQNKELYLEANPNTSSRGYLVGKLPRKIKTGDLRALGHPVSPIKAIRAKCLDCCGDNMAEARKCTATGCPLWPMRMGTNPFYGKGGGHA